MTEDAGFDARCLEPIAAWMRQRGAPLVGLIGDVKHLLTLKAVRDRLSESSRAGQLKAVVFPLLGAVTTYAIAQVTSACPGLLEAAPAILTAGVGGFITYLIKRPASAPKATSLVVGALSFGFAAGVAQLDVVCGEGFSHKVWGLLAAGAWVGVGLWLRAPHEQPPKPASIFQLE